MAKYLIFIYEDEATYAAGDEAMWARVLAEHGAFTEEVERMGAKIVGGEALEHTPTATSIRGGVGGTVTDGPFVETKEALGGFYVIEAADLDQAIAVAKRCPASGGGVEVRPVMTFG